MKRKFMKISAVITLIVLICGLSIALTGCKDDPPKPVPIYEVCICDDDWNELPYAPSDDGFMMYDGQTFEYDGKPKLFNAIVYCDGKEILRHDMSKDDFILDTQEASKPFIDIGIVEYVSGSWSRDNIFSIEDLPTEKGKYKYSYLFQEYLLAPRFTESRVIFEIV